jgi:hypothetical protein
MLKPEQIKEIESCVGTYFAITGTKEQLLEAEKVLRKLKYRSDRQNIKKRNDGNFSYIVVYEKFYVLRFFEGCASETIIDLFE